MRGGGGWEKSQNSQFQFGNIWNSGLQSGLWCDTSSKWVCLYLMPHYGRWCCINTLVIVPINSKKNIFLAQKLAKLEHFCKSFKVNLSNTGQKCLKQSIGYHECFPTIKQSIIESIFLNFYNFWLITYLSPVCVCVGGGAKFENLLDVIWLVKIKQSFLIIWTNTQSCFKGVFWLFFF